MDSPSPTITSSPSISSSLITASSPSPYFNSLSRRRQQKKMSITQTYYLAHTARRKLTREASRADHDLRLLVGHANLLDSLMLDLTEAEQEQERWFNQTVNGVTKSSQKSESESESESESRHIRWADTVVEDPEEDWDPEDASDSDGSDSDEEEQEQTVYAPIRRRAPSPVAIITEKEVEEDYDSDSDSDFEYDDMEDLEELTLTRSASRQSPPPELSSDSDEDSEDDAGPPSPPQPTLSTFSEKHPQSTEILLSESDGYEHECYIPGQEQATIIEAY